VGGPSLDVALLVRPGVLFLTGKGGTGKSTLAAAVGRLAASRGRRVVVCEVDAQAPALGALLGGTPGYEPTEIAPGLSTCNITWSEAIEDWVEAIVPVRRVVRMLLRNSVVHLFLSVTPGARDLVVLSRARQLAERFDLVIVDMPASGNAVAMLGVPTTAERLFPAGPVRRSADDMLALLGRPTTGVALVALPEEMVVQETVETARRLRSAPGGPRLLGCILNRAPATTLSSAEREAIAVLQAEVQDPRVGEIVAAGARAARLQDQVRAATERLAADAELAMLALPVLPPSESPAGVAAGVQRALGAALAGGRP
jgi:Mrp family chromosome partitioning ATPase